MYTHLFSSLLFGNKRICIHLYNYYKITGTRELSLEQQEKSV